MVVMYHVRLLNAESGDNYTFIYSTCDFLGYSNMQTFFLLSGMLLYTTRISTNWRTINLYKNKLSRLAIPLLFVTCLGNVAQMIFNGVVKHPHDITLSTFLQSFFLCDGFPWPHRWFLMVLLLMMALFPLYKLIMRNRMTEWLFLIALIILYHAPLHFYIDILCISKLKEYLLIFYFGMLVSKYALWKYLRFSWLPAILWPLVIGLYINDSALIEYCPNVYILLCSAAIISTSMLIDRRCPRLLCSYSNYVFQIYMFEVAFQAFVELILWRMLGCPDNLVAVFWLLNILFGIYMPVLISKAIERIPSRTLQLCLGLKHPKALN